MSRRRLSACLVVPLVLAAASASPAAHADAPARATALVDVTCPVGSQTGHYQPGLTYDPRQVSFSAEGNVSGCVDLSGNGVAGASFTASGSGTASCTSGSVSNRTTYHWSNGRSSTVQGTGAINVKPNGITVLVLTGTVESGLFAGATVVQTKALLNTDLTACLTPTGLTDVGGPITLTVTG